MDWRLYSMPYGPGILTNQKRSINGLIRRTAGRLAIGKATTRMNSAVAQPPMNQIGPCAETAPRTRGPSSSQCNREGVCVRTAEFSETPKLFQPQRDS